MGQGRGITAWLELSRVSNLPTVWSNALVGVALASLPGQVPWSRWAVAAAACSMLYIGGMIHNDVADAAVDRAERPGRPIPSGRVGRGAAGVAAVLLLLAGVHLLWFAGPWPVLLAAGLAVMIVAYNLLHRTGAWTVVLLGLCRAMVYVIGAASVAWPVDMPRVGVWAAVLAAYVIALSLLARREAGRPQRIKLVVLLICAISVLDALILVVLGYRIAAGVAVLCFVAAAWMQRRVIGT